MDATITLTMLLTSLLGAALAFMVTAVWFNSRVFGAVWNAGSNIPARAEQKPNKVALILLFLGLLSFSVLVSLTKTNLPVTVLITVSMVLIVAAIALFTKKSSHAVFVEMGFVIAISVVIKLVHRIL